MSRCRRLSRQADHRVLRDWDVVPHEGLVVTERDRVQGSTRTDELSQLVDRIAVGPDGLRALVGGSKRALPGLESLGQLAGREHRDLVLQSALSARSIED